MSGFRRGYRSSKTTYRGRHRYEHWYRDNQVYFITAAVRDHRRALADERAKLIFWEKFEQHTSALGFTPWVTSVLDDHYHTLGYLRCGEALPVIMRRVHGSTARLINAILPENLPYFWGRQTHRTYFDGCIRSEKQCRLAYLYVCRQGERHGYVSDWRDYPHTRIRIDLDTGVKRALERNAFMTGVRYKRYEK